ncbi:hypothetical protein IQ06DRAFT_102144 [Phaeosphaeriaceae sp. SRC1lsM3a]|nr:hypothetical protein IQ06DRAFT_102144 [Stagonospora sp. SRC1lsM3a]
MSFYTRILSSNQHSSVLSCRAKMHQMTSSIQYEVHAALPQTAVNVIVNHTLLSCGELHTIDKPAPHQPNPTPPLHHITSHLANNSIADALHISKSLPKEKPLTADHPPFPPSARLASPRQPSTSKTHVLSSSTTPSGSVSTRPAASPTLPTKVQYIPGLSAP